MTPGRVAANQTDAHAGPVERRSRGFVWLYALAWGGGVIAYAPFLSLVLPLRVEALAPDAKIALLSLITLTGSFVASGVGILIGVLSDRNVRSPRGRRPWVALGLVLTLASYALLSICASPAALLGAVVLFQIAVNTLLAPLGAIAADETPDSQKGVVSAAMGAGSTLGVLAGLAVTASADFDPPVQLAIIAVLVTACVLPFLLLSRRRGSLIPAADRTTEAVSRRRRDLVRVWIARLLIQVCGAILFAYLVFYLQTVDRSSLPIGPATLAGQAAWLSGSVSFALVPLALAIGRISDAVGLRRPFLVATAGMVTLGLVGMATAQQWAAAFAAYLLFSCGVGLFLALQNAYAMQLLTNPDRRGRDMGMLNLTNTLPSMAATGLAWVLARGEDFTVLLLVLAGLAAVATLLMMSVRDEPRTRP